MEKKTKPKAKTKSTTPTFGVPDFLRPIWSCTRRGRMWASSRKGAPQLIGMLLGVIIAHHLRPARSCRSEILGAVPDRSRNGIPASDGLDKLPLPAAVNLGNEDFEPNVILDGQQKIPPDVQKAQKPVRPRYYDSELGMHETLFVAVASGATTLPTLGVAFNLTTAHYLPRLSFFINAVQPDVWARFQNLTMNIVRSSETGDKIHPMLILRFLVENHMETFDWFFIAPDSTYIRGKELLEFVKKISVGKVIYLGVPSAKTETGYCDFSAGILISQAMLMGIAENLPWCMENARLKDFTESIGKCIVHIFGLRCGQFAEASPFVAFPVTDSKPLDSQDSTAELVDAEDNLQSAVAIYPLSEPKHFYRLHLELSQRKIGEIQQLIEEVQEDIVKQSPHTPGGGADLQWPIGINPPAIPKDRFDVIEWTYFNETHLFRPDDFRVAVRLVGSFLKSVEQVMAFAKTSIEERQAKLEVKISGEIRLLNGYVRFDPTRGIEYILDLAFEVAGSTKEEVRTLRLLRSLGQMEQIFLPFVTENSRVHLTVTIGAEDIPVALDFLKVFTKVHLEAQDNVFFMVVLIYGPNDPGKESPNDVFLKIKAEAKDIDKRYSKTLGTRLGWVSIRNPLTVPPSEFAIMDIVARKFSKDSIVFRCDVNFIPSVELLNRIRLTTIPGTQAYFPMPFVQYKPSIIYQAHPYPADFDVKRQFGHYDRDSVYFAAFFVSDYTAARRNEAENWPLVTADRDLLREYPRPNRHGQVYDLYTLFLSSPLHVFRGVEPALKVKFALLRCDRDDDPGMELRLRERCERRRLASLANKQQLAMFIAHQEHAKEMSLSTRNATV
ncbi:Chondroitin sulfate synthase 2 [Hypsibius exemplaris]|uniref:Hexosyltransferase n=1 Tax=Hypsibius exemplaris TaxID=2072580 RepID=A0A9X6RLM4_HYPEX|nr:Chondroitin sulfate synthase 2 [Hypsibius exemplaris]